MQTSLLSRNLIPPLDWFNVGHLTSYLRRLRAAGGVLMVLSLISGLIVRWVDSCILHGCNESRLSCLCVHYQRYKIMLHVFWIFSTL